MKVSASRNAGGALAVAAVLLAIASVGCSPTQHPTFQPSGPPLDLASSEQLARSTPLGAVAGAETSTAPVLRSQALAYLRTRGPVATRAADLLTVGFPQRTLSVPVFVRACRVNGHDAILVVEAWGGGDPTLDRRRLWVFDRLTGTIIAAAAFR